MKIIDTHSHIYSEEFDNDIDEVIDRAKKVGVGNILMPNIDVSSIARLHHISDKYSGYCAPMMGLHPTSVNENWRSELDTIKQELTKRKYIAIGEIGLDLYWDRTYEEEQKEVFEEQLRWSIDYDLPVAIHSRDAISQCISCIRNVGAEKLRGVFHSFGGTEEELDGILSLGGFMLGINGVVTFKNSTLSTVLRNTDLSHIIVETDAPYLAPVPYRGKRNEPSYTLNVVEKLAEIYGLTIEEIGEITSQNAEELFF
ncbi:TatD family deoxyribonuclease [Dysgonomonas sp. 521]|uniref:TatD family hydrolase n=1 Tax=Dysgonomonas sp. 521 TaxID=2302932 RepID=UPI0013D7CB76|nr:TatD family hydrolase [Dysgonomonas sp. 521]NDV95940.1 TatD family deoxyribonuclease [Dysgonomonas sp. 521]